MTQPPTSLAQDLLRAFMRLRRPEWVHRSIGSFSPQSLSGSSPGEIRALLVIRSGMEKYPTGMKVSEISNLLRVTSPSVTHLLKDLEARGLVERNSDPADRRTVFIRLSALGEQVAQTAGSAFVATFEGLIDYLGEEDSRRMVDLLAKASRYFEQAPADGALASRNGDEVV